MEKKYLQKIIEENKNIIYEEWFFDMLKSSSLLDFRKNINMVQEIAPTLFLEEEVDIYYEELLKNFEEKVQIFLEYQKLLKCFYDDNYELLEKYHDFNYLVDKKMIIQLEDYWHHQDKIELAYQYFLKNTKEKISEIVVDGLFKDTIYNVWINIREMLRYLKFYENDKKILSRDKIQFYQDILEIDKMSNEDKIELYHRLKNKNVALTFYQDLLTVKRYSYQKIKNCLFRVKDKNNLFQYQKSLQYHIPIYELNGDNFFMMVSCRNRYSSKDNVRRHCYSLISSYNMEVFSKKKFIYGYTDFSIDMIMHVFETDLESVSNFSDNSFTTGFVNRIMTPEQISYSNGYSEIQIANKGLENEINCFEVKKPNYLVVFDSIEERHIIEAKRLQIPIVVIPTSKYLNNIKNHSKNPQDLGFQKFETILDTYTNGSEIEIEKKSRR